MINVILNFDFDNTEFPMSVEEFAAFMDGNLPDEDMQRLSSVIEQDESMQGVMDAFEETELTLADYGDENLQLPEELAEENFGIPDTDDHLIGGGGFCDPFAAKVACAAQPVLFSRLCMEEDHADCCTTDIIHDETTSDKKKLNDDRQEDILE